MTPKTLPPVDVVRRLLDYDPESGVFTWKKRSQDEAANRCWNTRYAGKRAGTIASDGYRLIGIFESQYLAHRLAWLHVYGTDPGPEIDHKNNIPGDDRISNLRRATRKHNSWNLPAHKNRTLPKGVGKTGSGRFYASITVDGKVHHQGSFDTPEEAHAAYIAAAKKHFGEFARSA